MVALAKSAWTAAASACICSRDLFTSVTEAGGGDGLSAWASGVASSVPIRAPTAANRTPQVLPNTIKPPSIASARKEAVGPPRLSVGGGPGPAEPRFTLRDQVHADEGHRHAQDRWPDALFFPYGL